MTHPASQVPDTHLGELLRLEAHHHRHREDRPVLSDQHLHQLSVT